MILAQWNVGWEGESGDTAFLYYSDDYGGTWHASPSVAGLNECSIALLPPDAEKEQQEEERVLMNCRVRRGLPRAQVVWTVSGAPGGNATNMSRGEVEYKEELVDPGCQAPPPSPNVSSCSSCSCCTPLPPPPPPAPRPSCASP